MVGYMYVEREMQLSKRVVASQTRKRGRSRSRSALPVLRRLHVSKIKKLKQWSTDLMKAAVDAVLVEQALLTLLDQAYIYMALFTLVNRKTF